MSLVLIASLAGCGGGGGDGDGGGVPAPANSAPVVAGATLSITEDVTSTGTLSATDPNGDSMTASISVQPAKGTASITTQNPFTITYQPAPNQNGTDTLTATVSDSRGASTHVIVNVTISPQPDAPAIQAQEFSGNEDTPIAGLVAATDVDGDTLSFTALSSPAHGTLSLLPGGELSYTPAANYFGEDEFDVQVSDGTATSSATVSVQVNPVNDAPLGWPDVAAVTAPGPVTIDVLANDTDVEGGVLTVSLVTQAAGTSASVVGNQIQVTVNAGVSGPSSLQYRVTDAGGASSLSTLNLLIDSPRPVFYYVGDAGSPIRLIYRDEFFTNTFIDVPVPAGSVPERFVTSADGRRMVYVTRSSAPVNHRLWLKNLEDLSAPVQEIATGGNFFTHDLALSPDGNLVAFNNRLASTATPGTSVAIDIGPDGFDASQLTFTRDSSKLFYTQGLLGGGRIIWRADVNAAGAISNRTQMTANYNAAEGLGIQFRLTPDETRILSLGLMMPPPMVGGSIMQYAFVTTADGSMDDARLHPLATNVVDGVGFLPKVTMNGGLAMYEATLGGNTGIYSTDLQAPGAATLISSQAGPILAHRNDTLLFKPYTPNSTWLHTTLPGGTPAPFAPAGQPGPFQVGVAPDGTSAVFEQNAWIFAVLGADLTTPHLLARLPNFAPAAETVHFAPDSSSAVVLSNGSAVIVNPKSPGWNRQIVPAPSGGCVAYAGEGC